MTIRVRDSQRLGTALRLLPLLAVFWLMMSGHYSALLLMLGALSVAVVIWVILRMDVVDDESLPLRLVPRLPRYLPWLLLQVLLSALTVLRVVWSPRGARPAVGTVPAAGLADLSKVVYANSITLTPGTLSVSFRDEDIEIHGLRPEGITDLRDGEMLRRVRDLEAG